MLHESTKQYHTEITRTNYKFEIHAQNIIQAHSNEYKGKSFINPLKLEYPKFQSYMLNTNTSFP